MTPATSKSKDDSNSISAHNSRNKSNSRNESSNRTANTIRMPAKAGMLAKVVKPATACRETNYCTAVTLLASEMTVVEGIVGPSRTSTTAGPPESDSLKVSNSRETAIFLRNFLRHWNNDSEKKVVCRN